MSNFYETTDILRRYLKARIPVIVIHSIEPMRVFDILRHLVSEIPNLLFYEFSSAEGLKNMANGQQAINDISLISALNYAKNTFRSRVNAIFTFTEVEDLDTDTTTSRHFAQLARIAEQKQGSIILLVDKPVWSGLSRLGMSVHLDLPTTEELLETITNLLDGQQQGFRIEWGPNEFRQAAEILSGITETEAINVLATLLAKGQIRNSDLSELPQFKDAIFGELAGIERIPLKENYQIGGLTNLKQWLHKREILIKTDLSTTSLHPPKGVLLCGVPGCGKSLSAKTIAHEWELPLYRLDMSAVMGMYHGESESNLREALATADRVAPCVLWIDEIEKGLATGAGDNAVTKRLIGQFLFWLQESTSKVFLVATANDVSALPPELLRKGRFDEVFFVDLPTNKERQEILEMCFKKYTKQVPADDLLADLVELSNGFAGSDLDAVVHDIASEMLAKNSDNLPDASYIKSIFINIMPFSRSNPEEVKAIREWGQTRAIPAGETNPVVTQVLDNPFHSGSRQVVL